MPALCARYDIILNTSLAARSIKCAFTNLHISQQQKPKMKLNITQWIYMVFTCKYICLFTFGLLKMHLFHLSFQFLFYCHHLKKELKTETGAQKKGGRRQLTSHLQWQWSSLRVFFPLILNNKPFVSLFGDPLARGWALSSCQSPWQGEQLVGGD